MNTFDCSDETEWDLAERAVATVGTPPSLFTAAIRAIRNAPSILQTADEAALSKFSVSAALFPVKVSPTLKASFYFAAEELFEQKLRAARPLTPARLLGLFHPDEVAAIITLTLLNRAIRGRCPADEWEKIVPRMNAHMMVGGVVGRSMKMVGFGNGLLMAGIRYLSLGTMIATAPKRYKELRRSMDVSTALFLPEVEQKVFGCTHLHIASTLVSAMGYGVVPRLALGIHEPPDAANLQSAIQEAKEEIEAWRVALLAMEALHTSGALPDSIAQRHASLFHTGALAQLQVDSGFRESDDFGYQWLNRSRKDLPKEVLEQLEIKPDAVDDEPKKTSAATA